MTRNQVADKIFDSVMIDGTDGRMIFRVMEFAFDVEIMRFTMVFFISIVCLTVYQIAQTQ